MSNFIHTLPDWPNFTWDLAQLLPMLTDVRHQQGVLLGRLAALGFEHRSDANLATLTDDIVSSSAIEGERFDPAEVRSSVAMQLGLDVGGLRKTSRNVDGVVEMMLDATQNYDAALTAERLFGWHAALFPIGRSGMRKITTAAWRTPEEDPMRVVSGAIHKQKIHFEAPTADRVSSEMDRLLRALSRPADEPLLHAGVAHLWFLTVHPFADGNGRIARAITDLLLARLERSSMRFYSMSSQIAAERRDYYDELEAAQRGSLDITSWLGWFLGCFGRAVDAAQRHIDGVLQRDRFWRRANSVGLNERQRKVLFRMLDRWEGTLTTSKYAKIARCSHDTALRDITMLLNHRLLVRSEGGGRSTSYTLAHDLES